MFGFVIAENAQIANDDPKYKRIEWSNGNRKVSFFYNELPKFKDDHLFYENEKHIVLVDGVILNKKDLMVETDKNEWKDSFEELMASDEQFMKRLRGSFRGVICYKESGRIVAFTDQTGAKTVFYSRYEDGILIFSHIECAIEVIGSKKWLSPDIRSSWELLITGSILRDRTPFKDVRRVTAGKYAIFNDGSVSVIRYHMFRNVPEHEISMDECVEEADRLFTQAVGRIFEKSAEYGYRHEADLSGGVDSRLANFYAHKLGYDDLLNVCYSVSGSMDNRISEKISKDLGNEYLFYPMDGKVLLDMDEKTRLTGGQVLYSMSSGAYHVLDELEKRNVGLTCMGLLGEMEKADWVQGYDHLPARYIYNRKSRYFNLDLNGVEFDQYDNYEQMALYEYGFKLIVLSTLTRQQTVEFTSPFLDTDYLEFVFSIPLKYRKDYRFVDSLVVNKMPEAADYVWQTVKMPVSYHYAHKLYIPKIFDDIQSLSQRAVNKLFRKTGVKFRFIKCDDMNPFDAWYNNDRHIRCAFDGYFRENVGSISDEKLLRSVEELYQNSHDGADKIQAVNLVSLWKNYFSK